ncbi:MAG: MurR/RpiR family transcriptional regulator [Saccharofermentanales bacterium]
MNEIMVKIQNSMNFLPRSERVIAEHLLQNPGDAIRCSATELSEKCGTSKAAVVRFCRSMDFTGYRGLCTSIAESLSAGKAAGRAPEPQQDIRAGDSIQQIIRTVSSNNIKAIQDTMRIIETETIQFASDIIFGAGRILVCGAGASLHVAQDLEEKLIRIHLPCNAFADSSIQKTAAANLGIHDVVIAISWSGSSKDVIDVARIARKAGAKVISLTSSGRNKLIESSDIALFAAAPENRIRFGAMSSRIAIYTLADILFSVMVSGHYDTVKPYLEKTYTALQSTKYT